MRHLAIPLIFACVIPVVGCSDDPMFPDLDSGSVDAGGLMDGEVPDGGDAAVGEDAGPCTEFKMEGCAMMYSMMPIPIEEVCSRFSELFCRANEACCGRPAEVYPSLTACHVAQVTRCFNMELGLVFNDAIGAGDIRYSQTGTGASYADLGPMADMCVPLRFDHAITRAMTGTVTSGGACTPLSCASGLDCTDSGSGPTCSPALSDGSTCDAAGHCGQGDLACVAGTCRSLGAEGSTCGSDEECGSRLCEGGTCAAYDANAAYCVRQETKTGPAFRR